MQRDGQAVAGQAVAGGAAQGRGLFEEGREVVGECLGQMGGDVVGQGLGGGQHRLHGDGRDVLVDAWIGFAGDDMGGQIGVPADGVLDRDTLEVERLDAAFFQGQLCRGHRVDAGEEGRLQPSVAQRHRLLVQVDFHGRP